MEARNAKFDLADVHTPLLHDHWYVAGYADEFDEGLHERTFLNRSLVIYRMQDGQLVALQNRCAHRSYPLSHGIRDGDNLRCNYHGAVYNPLGEMIEFPSMVKCPRIAIRHYPMRVQGALAWIWMGSEEAMLRLPEPPATLWLEAGADWAYATGHYDLVGNWILMAENLMDLTHIPFLHQASFNFPKAFAQAPVKLEISGDRLSYYRDNPPNYQRSGFLPTEASEAIEAAGFQARSTVRFVSPALTHGGGRFVLDRPGPEAQPTYEWQVIHFTTPITDRETKYWYFFARNYSLDDRALTEKLKTMIVNGFEEDRVAIELVQVMHEKDTHDYREVHFKSDAPSVAMRRIVAGMARREAEARRSPANASSIDQIEQIAAE